MRTLLRNMAPMMIASMVCGCGEAGEVLDLGDNSPPEEIGASLADYAGSWDGYAEAYEFKDGSDRVRLRIDANGNGRLEVGSSPAPSLPSKDDPEPVAVAANYGLLPGYGYEITGASVEDHRIRLTVPVRQLAERWCPQFEPVRHDPAPLPGDPFYTCYDAQQDPSGEICVYGGLPSACGARSCGLFCTCTDSGCGASPPNAGTGNTLDGSLEQDGDGLVGTLHVSDQRLTIRLTRK